MRKLLKTISLLTAFIMCFSICGCNSNKKNDNFVSGMFEYHDISFKLADSYEYDAQRECLMCYDIDGSGLINLQVHNSENDVSAKSVFDYQCKTYEEKDSFGYAAEISELNIDDIEIAKITWDSDDKSNKTYIFILNNDVYTINFSTNRFSTNDCSMYSKSDEMINSLCFNKQETPTEALTESTIEKETTESAIEEYVLDSEYTINDITFKVSSDWQFKEGTDSYVYNWYTNSGNFIMASCHTVNSYNFDADNQREYLNGLEESGCEILKSENVTLPNISNNALKTRFKTQGVTFTDYAFLLNDQLYSIGGTEDVGGSEGNLNYIEKVIDSIEINEPPKEKSTELSAEPATEKNTEPPTEEEKITLGMRNALSKAKDYLSFTAFSYTGLIDQLEYEGYTTEEATYGADNCGADWNEQAAKKAQNYIDFTSFSRQGLIDQLLYEGFTEEQAEYGVTAIGY